MNEKDPVSSQIISIVYKGSNEYLGLYEYYNKKDKWRFSGKVQDTMDVLYITKDNLKKIAEDLSIVRQMINDMVSKEAILIEF